MSTMIKNKVIKFKDGSTYKVSVEKYNSAEEVVNDCNSRQNHDYEDMRKKNYNDWSGVKSYDDAMNLLKYGYQPTVEKMQNALKFNKQGSGKRISFNNDVHGFAPIVPLALKGVPNSMVNTTMKTIKCKVIDVYYDLDALAYVDSCEIIKAGQTLLQTIIELEKQGYKFNLYALQSYTGEHDTDMLCVKMKSSDKPFDLKRMSFPLTHTAFLRVIGFDWQGKSPIAKYRGCGRGSNLRNKVGDKDKINKIITDTFGDNAVYITFSNISSNGEDYIKEVLTNVRNNKVKN